MISDHSHLNYNVSEIKVTAVQTKLHFGVFYAVKHVK